jgi:hypothetical protein
MWSPVSAIVTGRVAASQFRMRGCRWWLATTVATEGRRYPARHKAPICRLCARVEECRENGTKFHIRSPDDRSEAASPEVALHAIAGDVRMWGLIAEVGDPLFVAVAHSARVRCIVCDREGNQTDGGGWQHACLLGHAPCPGCGKIIGLTNAGRVRRCHTGCPNPKVAPVVAPRYQPRERHSAK